jgi:DNA-binding MarR family transcriptional regulator
MNKDSGSAGRVESEPQRETMLALLNALDDKSNTTQRSIASRAGVALGLANSLIKRCVRKGLVKIGEAPARRYVYYLTPEGFAEKARLTAEYLSSSLDFYRRARREYAELFKICERRGWRRVALAGGGELAEIALLSTAGTTLDFVVIDDQGASTVHGRPAVASLEAAGPVDGIILSDARNAQAHYAAILAKVGAARVLSPDFLRVSAVETARSER